MRVVRLLSFPALAVGGILLPGLSRSARSSSDDAATVAALDTKYQAAVKANDWVGMDAILADDFVLVTGTGKVFTKKDLPDERLWFSDTYVKTPSGWRYVFGQASIALPQ